MLCLGLWSTNGGWKSGQRVWNYICILRRNFWFYKKSEGSGKKKKKCIRKESSTPDHAMCSKALIDIKEMQALGLGMDLGFNSSLMYHFHVSVHLHLTGVAQPCICGGELEGMSCMRSALLSTDTDQHNTEEAGASGLQGCHLVTSILSSTGSCAKNNLASPED